MADIHTDFNNSNGLCSSKAVSKKIDQGHLRIMKLCHK